MCAQASHEPSQKAADDSAPPHANDRLEALRAGIRKISHDINNPLSVIRMAVHFLQTTNPSPEKCHEYFQVINANLQRIEEGIEQLRMLRESSS